MVDVIQQHRMPFGLAIRMGDDDRPVTDDLGH